MSNNICVSSDFVYDPQEKILTHEKSMFMLDSDFVLLFENKRISNIFNGATGYFLGDEVIENLRSIILEHQDL